MSLTMTATTRATFSALVGIDSGTLVVELDQEVFPTAVVRAWTAEAHQGYSAQIDETDGTSRLCITASTNSPYRETIGNALTDLLTRALRHRLTR